MYNLNTNGVDSPELSFSADEQTILRRGLFYKAKNTPFDTTGDWEVDKANFAVILDFTDLQDPVPYLEMKYLPTASADLMEGGIVELTDEQVNGPSALTLERQWVSSELKWCDDNLRYVECAGEGETRGKGTATETRQYKVKLRNHAQGDRPTRPV